MSTLISLLEGFVLPIGLAFILSFAIGGNGIWISFALAELGTILFIYAYSRYINKKTDGEYTGFFINKHNDDTVFEYTINSSIEEAVKLSSQVQDYIKDTKTGTVVSLAIEEMLVNIINTNKNDNDTIDVIVRDNSDNILISIKDTGIDFNPVIENENLEFDNISVLNKIADKIDYSRVLGLNSTVIIINK